MIAELLLEIGTEEIPSGYLEKGLQDFKELARACLAENRIEVAGGLYTYGTPRRLVLIGKAMADAQSDLVQEMTGPPRSAAYDAEGKPTKAAIGFAQKQGVSVDELQIKTTAKGDYLFVQRTVPGRKTSEVLAEALPRLIAQIPWPKSMRWGAVGFPFVRPIHWVLCLLNGQVVPFQVAGIQTGNTSRGHRFLGPESLEIEDVADYLRLMPQAFVLIDPKERQELVDRAVAEKASMAGGRPIVDPELTATVANLVEYPSAVCGRFDRSFLDLPQEVLITAMRQHQKYFAVTDAEGRLLPAFVAINNTRARNESVVQAGHERVLRARLSDADFFFREDRKRRLEDRLEDLKSVIYHAQLGTSRAKVERFIALAQSLCQSVAPDSLDQVRQVARLCKCDLVTHIVGEFPSLQGVMGRVYAHLEGYAPEVAAGIEEHYFPLRAGAPLPASLAGAVVGVADRLDTLAGCFAVGLEPTGSADPFALRRHALALIRTIESFQWDVSLSDLLKQALLLLSQEIALDHDQTLHRVVSFIRDRYRNLLLNSGYEADPVDAVLSVTFDRIHALRSRVDQLRQFSIESGDFHVLTQTCKRVNNILKNQTASGDVRADLFEDPSESALWETCLRVEESLMPCLEEGDVLGALAAMAVLRKPVDDFFEQVEVLTKDRPPLRQNRVALLHRVSGLMGQIADFSKFS